MLNRTIKYLCTALILPAAMPVAALNINLIGVDGFSVANNETAWLAFERAAEEWEAILADPVTVNLEVGYEPLDAGVIGQTGSASMGVTYNGVRTALIADDMLSVNDAEAVDNLPTGNTISFITNNLDGSLVVDNNGSANNLVLDINTANAKALGLRAANDASVDGAITFNSDFSFDYDPDNGISDGYMDFVGVATHEIGHALGFVSGVDIVDLTSGDGVYAPVPGSFEEDLLLDPYRVFSVLDLYRYSGLIADAEEFYGITLDFDYAVYNSDDLNPYLDGSVPIDANPYFSLDGGLTSLALFSTGRFNGDGRQASHWKDNLGLGILDPTAGYGELLQIDALDRLAMDVIGWDLIDPAAVPLPAAFWFFGSGLLVLLVLFPNLNPPNRPDLNQTTIANRAIGYNGNVVKRISLENFRF
ncbi:MAG: NF038122 family metalloprotease [Sedimenticola sp.]